MSSIKCFFLLSLLIVVACLSRLALSQAIPPGSDLSAYISSSAGTTKSFTITDGTWPLSSTIVLTASYSLTLIGEGASTIIDCGGAQRGFYLTNGAILVLQKLSLINCLSDDSISSSPPPQNGGGGAAISSIDSVVSLSEVVFIGDTSSGSITSAAGGGAIFLDGASQLEVDDCTFQKNTASNGGAIFATGSATVDIKGTAFESNSVAQDGDGGALYCTSSAICTVSGSSFTRNLAGSGLGGSIYSNGKSKMIFESNLYTENQATYGGAQYADDDSVANYISETYVRNKANNNGGVAEVSGTANVTWKYGYFKDNTASGTLVLILRGGDTLLVDSCIFEGVGEYNNNEAMVGVGAGDITVRNSTFKGGFSGFGGGLSIGGNIETFLLEDSLFIDNAAFDRGALSFQGLSLSSYDLTTNIVIRSTRFENNRAISSGGAIGGEGANKNFLVQFIDCEFINNKAGVSGGVGYFKGEGLFTFKDCTFEGNTAQKGGVFSVDGSAQVEDSGSNFQTNSGYYGGVLFATENGKYVMTSSAFLTNTASLNGGVYYSDFLSTTCPEFTKAKFISNTATQSGGGLFFELDSSELPCEKVSSFCDRCVFTKNLAQLGYGTDYATSPLTLVPYDTLPNTLYPSQTFNTSLLVLDGFNQTLLGFIDMEVTLQIENSNDTYVIGTLTRQPTREGKVVFDDVIFGVLPGSKVKAHFSSDPTTSAIDLHIKIDDCDSDQVLYERDSLFYCLDEREPDDIAVILVYIAVALILALSFITLVLLVWKRHKKPINNATPSMCYTIVVGVVFCAVSVAMWTKAHDVTCSLRGWLLAIGLTLIFGAIFVRAYRLLLIFNKANSDVNSKVARRVIDNQDLFIGLSVLLAGVMVILIVWAIVAPPNKRDVIEIDVSTDVPDNSITYECDYGFPSSVFIIALIVAEALLLAFNCVVALLTRNLPSNFNESRHVAFTMYNGAIMMTVAIVLVIVFNDEPTAILIIVALTILFNCLVILVLLFAPKLYLSFLNKQELIQLLNQEKHTLLQEIWAKERESTDLKSRLTLTASSASMAGISRASRADTRSKGDSSQ